MMIRGLRAALVAVVIDRCRVGGRAAAVGASGVRSRRQTGLHRVLRCLGTRPFCRCRSEPDQASPLPAGRQQHAIARGRRDRCGTRQPWGLPYRPLPARARSTISNLPTYSALPSATTGAGFSRRKATSPIRASAWSPRQEKGRWFVSDVYDGLPADRAGILVGDEIAAVDGKPYREIGSFEGKVGQTVEISLRRRADDAVHGSRGSGRAIEAAPDIREARSRRALGSSNMTGAISATSGCGRLPRRIR